MDEYESVLRIDAYSNVEYQHVEDAYDATVSPLLALAERAGFRPRWRYQ